jgi:hypothetical protein
LCFKGAWGFSPVLSTPKQKTKEKFIIANGTGESPGYAAAI